MKTKPNQIYEDWYYAKMTYTGETWQEAKVRLQKYREKRKIKETK